MSCKFRVFYNQINTIINIKILSHNYQLGASQLLKSPQVVRASCSLVLPSEQDAVLRGHATRSPEVRLTHYKIKNLGCFLTNYQLPITYPHKHDKCLSGDDINPKSKINASVVKI